MQELGDVNGAVVFLLLALAISVVGSVVAYLRSRSSASLDVGIDDFRREMRAIAPRGEGERRRSRRS
jgi:hypothetical protein